MKNKKSLYIVGTITVLAAVVFLNGIVHGYAYALDDIAVVRYEKINSYDVALPAHVYPPGYPSELRIPSIGVNAHIQETGITKKGNMGAPTNYYDVAWYAYGTVPGEIGSAVIDGHVDNALGFDGVFKYLPQISVGADMYVVTKGGSKLHFVVTSIDTYDYKTASVDKIFNERDGVKLKLITCEGAWIPSEKTYDKRLIVTAVLKS